MHLNNSAQAWECLVREKQDAREEALEAVARRIRSGESKTASTTILEVSDLPTLISRIAAGEITAQSLTTATIFNALNAQKETNCLSEPLFGSALRRARELDEHLQMTGTVVGPLHGVPMTFKDQFNVQGIDTSIGYVGRSFKPAETDAVLVNIMRKLGAIIIAKTTIPQSILWNETESPLWGVTTYPGRPHLSPGGSSGGEAAVLAMSGSVLGWGTDIGGSIRQPAALCGLFGLKPSSTRLPYSGVPVSHDGQMHVPSSVGPLTRDLSTLVTIMKECLAAQPWILDPNVTPLPWREDAFQSIQTRPLRIGIIFDDGVVKPHPELEAAVRLAADLLEAAGHETMIWGTSDHIGCIQTMDQFYRADGGEDIRREIQVAGEPMIPHVAGLVNPAKPISVYEYWQLNRRKIQAQEDYNTKWNETAFQTSHADDRLPRPQQRQSQMVDVLISPVAPHTAIPHRSARWTGYTKIWNFLDYTALAIPFGRFGQKSSSGNNLDICAGNVRQDYVKNHVARNDLDRWNQALYDPHLMDGLPIGLQIVGRRFEEEKVLGVAKVMERLKAERLKSS